MSKLRWWEDEEQVARLEKRYAAINVDRRHVLKMVSAAAGAGSMAAILAACGGDDDDDSGGDDTDSADTSGDATEPAESGGDATEPAESSSDEAEPTDSGGEDTEPTDSGGEDTESTDSSGADGELAAEQVIRLADEEDPAHFDFNRDLYAGGAAEVFAQLGKFNVDYEAVPDIAESWEPNDDASVWTFKIRQDTKWSNGDPMTAHDFVFSFKRQLDPATEASYAGFLYDIKNAEAFNLGEEGITADDVGVRAIDDFTLETTMEQPTAYWPDVFSYVAAAPAHQPSVEKYGDVWTDPNEVDEVVSNGPFKLVSWDHNVKYVIEKNDQYYGAADITLDRAEFSIISPDGWMLAYENDEIDQITRGELGQLDRIDGDDQLSSEKFIFNTYGTWYLVPDPNFEPFDVPEVRMAMNHAIDRETISNQVLRGLAKPAFTFQPPGTPSFIEETFPELTEYDPDKAMSLLDGTKYEGGKNWPKITMTHREEGDGPKIAADAMIAMLKENLGMDIEHEIGEPRTTYQRMYNHEIQLMWVRWYIDYPDPNNMAFTVWYSQFPSGSRHSWSNPEYDQLVSDARSVADFAERLEMYKQAAEIQLQDGAAIYVYYVYAYGLNKPWIGGMPTNSAGEPTPGWNVFIRDLDHYKILKR